MKRSLAGWLWVSPAAAVYVPLVLLPLGYSLVLALHRWNGLADTWDWRGLANFVELCGDRVFWQALLHNLALIAVSLGVQLPVALGLAVLVQGTGRWTALLRTSFFLPYVLPTVVIALVWQLLIWEARPMLLHSPVWALPTVMGVICWRFVGFHLALYLAGLSAIDPQLYEAARIDGAGRWACFRHLTLPLLRPVLLVSATLAVVGSVKYFDIIYVMTDGGPAHATELLATYLYQTAFDSRRFGYASTIAVVLVLLALAATALMHLLARRRQS